jgi:hypothetical protein
MKPLALATFLALVLGIACSAEQAAPASITKPAETDYIILAKNHYSGTPGARSGYYVTIVVGGAERETEIDSLCFRRLSVGVVLPPDCG